MTYSRVPAPLPVFCKPYMVERIPCLDGGVSDPVPIAKTFEDGCDKVVLILDAAGQPKARTEEGRCACASARTDISEGGERLLDRYRAYNDGVEIAEEYQKIGKLLIVAPDDICRLGPRSARAMKNCRRCMI